VVALNYIYAVYKYRRGLLTALTKLEFEVAFGYPWVALDSKACHKVPHSYCLKIVSSI